MVHRVRVNPTMIKWAREDIGLSLNQLPVHLKDAEAWEKGVKQPTWNDLRRLAKKYKRPPVFYLMSKPPKEEKKDIIEFRSPKKIDKFNYDLNLEIRKAKYRRNIFIKINTYMGNNLPDFSKFSIEEKNPFKLAIKIRKLLNIPFETQKKWLKNDDGRHKYDHSLFLYEWKEILYELGILVFETENISEDVMSGMSLYFDECPIILLNGKNNHNRRIFTLMHELSHLTRKETAICDVDKYNEKETFCNKVAAEILVPNDTLKDDIIIHKNGDINYSGLSNKYGVSQQVIVYRLADIGKISSKEKKEKIQDLEEKNYHKKEKQKNKKSQGGGMSKPAKKKKYDGKSYTRFILNAYENNIISSSKFMRYLDLPVDIIDKLYDEIYG